MGEFDWAALLGGALQAAAIGGGLIFAGRQVKISADQNKDAERWRRTEFAASLMARLSKDEELALCARALDWGVGPLIVPAKYRTLFAEARGRQTSITTISSPNPLDIAPPAVDIQSIKSDATAAPGAKYTRQLYGHWKPIESDAQFTHNWARLARAVRPGLDADWADPRMLVYRYCFDSLGEFLETIQRYIDLGTVDPAHLFGLRYYLDKLKVPIYYRNLDQKDKLVGVEAEDVFRPFMKTYYPDGWHLVENRYQLPGSRSYLSL
jgi:hypothetical protein